MLRHGRKPRRARFPQIAVAAQAGHFADRAPGQKPRPVLRPGQQRGPARRGIEPVKPEQLAGKVQPVGQRGRAGEREGIARGTALRQHLCRDRLFVIERGKGQRVIDQRGHARAMADRDDCFDRMSRPRGQCGHQPCRDALCIEPAKAIDHDRFVGAHLAVDQPPVARPQRGFGQRLAAIDDDGRAAVHACLSPAHENDHYQSFLIVSSKMATSRLNPVSMFPASRMP